MVKIKNLVDILKPLVPGAMNKSWRELRVPEEVEETGIPILDSTIRFFDKIIYKSGGILGEVSSYGATAKGIADLIRGEYKNGISFILLGLPMRYFICTLGERLKNNKTKRASSSEV